MKKLLMTTAALAAFCAGPLSPSSTTQLDHWSFVAMAEAGNGNGGGAGNAGGNGNGNGNNGAANPGHTKSVENSSAPGNANGNGNANANRIGKTPDAIQLDTKTNMNNDSSDDGIVSQAVSRETNLHAVLGRINSIGRNVNGIMNSKDPHLAGIRSYILNSAELAKAETAADAAHAAYDAALADFNDAGLTGDPATTLTQLTSAVASADPSTLADLYEQIDVTYALLAASNTLIAHDARVAQFTILASDAALADALASMSNRTLTATDISSDTLEWSKAVLGVGDATGAIDSYIAQEN